jgi:hypothetical protein
LPLLKTPEGANLALQRLGIRGMSGKMMSHVWLSRPGTYRSTRAMFCELLARDEKTVIEATTRNDQGLPVPQEMCPKRLWINGESELRSGSKATPLPALFYSGSYWILSAKAADIFRAFDLGEGSLYPVPEGIYLADNATRIKEDFFCWIRGNIKDSFIQAQSRGIRPFSQDGVTMETIRALKEDDLAVSERALSGPAVWMEKNLYQCVILAGGLGDELVKVGLREAFALHRCRVVARYS